MCARMRLMCHIQVLIMPDVLVGTVRGRCSVSQEPGGGTSDRGAMLPMLVPAGGIFVTQCPYPSSNMS